MIQEFTKDLANLLEKYRVDICFIYEGDTYGIYGEKIVIIEQKERKIILEIEGSNLDANELRDSLK